MLVSSRKIDEFIEQWKNASKRELRERLRTLKSYSYTEDRLAEEKAIRALLA